MPELPPVLVIRERILSGEKFKTVLISDKLGIPEVLAGFILTKAGVVVEKPGYSKLTSDVVARADKRLSIGLKTQSIPLYNRSIQNPHFLQEVILGSDLDSYTKRRLKRLALHAELYRGYKPNEWWRAGVDLQDDKVANLSFYQCLATRLLVNADSPPKYAYDDCIKGLDQLLSEVGEDLNVFKQEYADESLVSPDQLDTANFPITTTAPVFKNPISEPDELVNTQFEFNLGNLALLKHAHLGLVVGGSPNSGKSTLTLSLYEAMKNLVHLGIAGRVVEAGEVNIGICDLDLAAPTLKFIARGEVPPKQRGEPWSIDSLLTTRRNFVSVIERCNVTLGDLPGGKPDDYTELLAHPAHSSIVLDRDYRESMKRWQDYFLGADYPPFLIAAHSRFNDPYRKDNGIRIYDSIAAKRSATNFLGGRVVDFNRTTQPDNPFVDFAAKVLLLDYLPQSILAKHEYRRNLGRSLGLIN